MIDPAFESILVVFQNPLEGRQESYDDWYTNVHIRDALRLEGAIATQRFIVHEDQLILAGEKVRPSHWAHTIYEWESAAKSVRGHRERAGSSLMEITGDCSFEGLRDYFFRPKFLSHGWSRETGFRKGDAVLTVMIRPVAGEEDRFMRWFEERHAPAALAMPGIGSVGLFTLHEEQSLPSPCPFPLVAIYGLTDVRAALVAWQSAHGEGGDADLASAVAEAEATCWKKRIPRLLARDVLNPSPQALEKELQTREKYRDRYLSADDLSAALAAHC